MYIHNGLHTLVRWVTGTASDNSGGTAPTKDAFMRCGYEDTNDSPNGGGNSFYSQYWLISENYMFGSQRGWIQGNQNNDPTASGIKNFVVQQNAQTGFTADNQLNPNIGYTVTERDNLVWGNSGGIWWSPGNGPNLGPYLTAQIYREKIYTADSGGSGSIIDYTPGNTGLTWTTKQIVTNNTIWATSATAKVIGITFSDFTSAGSIINNNSYYVPANSTAWYNATSADSFATWQAGGWDVNGANGTNPGWTNPPISPSSFGLWPFQ